MMNHLRWPPSGRKKARSEVDSKVREHFPGCPCPKINFNRSGRKQTTFLRYHCLTFLVIVCVHTLKFPIGSYAFSPRDRPLWPGSSCFTHKSLALAQMNVKILKRTSSHKILVYNFIKEGILEHFIICIIHLNIFE